VYSKFQFTIVHFCFCATEKRVFKQQCVSLWAWSYSCCYCLSRQLTAF